MTVYKELDETAYWLELLAASGAAETDRITPLARECQELLSIFTVIAKTSKRTLP